MDNYFAWLAGFVCLDDGFHDLNSYSLLMEKLYSEEFIPMVDMDDNRIADGLYLRDAYANEVGRRGHWMRHLSNTCSIFEMMVALSNRCDVEYNMPVFWTMLDISGLMLYTNDNFDEEQVEYVIDQLFNIYSPISWFDEPKEIEVWNQAMNYIWKHSDCTL